MTLIVLNGCEDNAESRLPDPGAPPATLVIRPSFVSLSTSNTYANFEVSGGSPPYQWDVSDKTLGSVPDSYTPVATYTRKTVSGINVISVRDNNHWSAQATVYQE